MRDDRFKRCGHLQPNINCGQCVPRTLPWGRDPLFDLRRELVVADDEPIVAGVDWGFNSQYTTLWDKVAGAVVVPTEAAYRVKLKDIA